MTIDVGLSFISELNGCFNKKRHPALFSDPASGFHISTLGGISRILRWKDQEFHKERINRLAAALATSLYIEPRNSDALGSKLKTAHRLLHEAKEFGTKGNHVEWLHKEFLAAKLGLAVDTLDKNEGFYNFAITHHLDKYLNEYQHTLEVNPENSEILILQNGQMRPWKEVYQEIQQWAPHTKKPIQTWVYGPNGIQNKNMYDWDTLEPYMKGNPDEWGTQYVFEYCACVNPKARITKTGSHSWIRLKTPEGDIYSVGLYREEKRSPLDTYKFPLRTRPAFLMSPDVSEFWGFPITRVEHAITKEQFESMKKMIEEDKRSGDLVFHLVNGNCVLYCKKVGAAANLNIPTAESAAEFLTPSPLYDRVTKFVKKLPAPVQKICRAVPAFFINAFHLFAGGSRIDNQLTPAQKAKAQPHFKSVTHLFDHSKSIVHFPQTLALKRKEQIYEWREEQIREIERDCLDNKESRIQRVRFTIPDEAVFIAWLNQRKPKN